VSTLFVAPDHVARLVRNIETGRDWWARVGRELRWRCEEAMAQGPWSVVWTASPEPAAGPHDFYSQAPYWWPDPDDPDGPHVRRDGERNPDRFMAHWDALVRLSKTVLFLASGGVLLDEPAWRRRAAELIGTWFVDPETRMAPHLDFGEAIKGRVTGRPAGIIALRQVDRIVHAASLMDESPEWAPVAEGFCDWLAAMLRWLLESETGSEEGRRHNNHASWWTTHVATYAAYIGDGPRLQTAFEHFRTYLLPDQMAADGNCPRELERTRALYYSLFNMDAWTCLCELAHHRGVDLWRYQTETGISVERGIAFLAPFVEDPYTWRRRQIDGIPPEDRLALQLGALRLDRPDWARINRKALANRYLIRAQDPLGPHCLLPGFSYEDRTWEALAAF
jgi:hypothetical protein